MITVSYRSKEGHARKLAVPEIDGVEATVMLAGVVKQAIGDAGPVAYVRLVTDTEAVAASVPDQTDLAQQDGTDGGGKHK